MLTIHRLIYFKVHSDTEKEGTVIIPIFQMEILRLRGANSLQGSEGASS